MSEELQQKLRDQLWEVANKLRGNMSASDFMYFTLGFIFYKYLSERGCRLLHRTDLPFLIGDRPDKEEREHIAHS